MTKTGLATAQDLCEHLLQQAAGSLSALGSSPVDLRHRADMAICPLCSGGFTAIL